MRAAFPGVDPRFLKKLVKPGVHLSHGLNDSMRLGLFAYDYLHKSSKLPQGFMSLNQHTISLRVDGPINVSKIGKRCEQCFQNGDWLCKCTDDAHSPGCDFSKVFNETGRRKVRSP